MSKIYQINFSGEDVAMDGVELAKAKEKAVKTYRGQFGDKLTSDQVEYIKESVISKRESEKNMLKLLFQNAAQDAKDFSDMNEIKNSVQEIDNCNGFALIPETDLNRVEKSLSKFQNRGGLILFPELIGQLHKPTEYKKPENETAIQKS